MSSAYITQFSVIGKDNKNVSVQAPEQPAVGEEKLTFSTSAASAAFGGRTNLIRIVSPTDCHYKVSESPVATTSNTYLPGGTVEYFSVKSGQKIAFIDA